MVKYKYDAWGNHAALYLNKVNDKEQYSEADEAAFDENYAKNKTLAELNPFRYRGYYYDEETGLYYLKSRYYDPEVGRFITIDDISYIDPETINGLNLYAYCGNNPVMRTDSQGTNWWTDFWNSVAGKIIGTILVVAAIVVRQYQRFELGERNITSASAKLMLSICMALKIDPYMFFPDIKED